MDVVVSQSHHRERLAAWLESSPVQLFIIAVILVNALILGLDTSSSIRGQWGGLLATLDQLCLVIFVVEIGLKLYALGPRFVKSGWNVFDFVVVAIALTPDSGAFAVLRALRVLRVLRMASMMPKLRFVVEALLHAVPGISSIAALLLIIYYVFAVIATNLFGPSFPAWFGTLGASMYTLFQVMTLESWSMGISRPVMEVYPWAWAFFVPFILVATFTMLNLFIAIIVNTMQALHDRDEEQRMGQLKELADAEVEPLHAQLSALRQEVAALRSELKQMPGRSAAEV